jgi:hypothetical protein
MLAKQTNSMVKPKTTKSTQGMVSSKSTHIWKKEGSSLSYVCSFLERHEKRVNERYQLKCKRSIQKRKLKGMIVVI